MMCTGELYAGDIRLRQRPKVTEKPPDSTLLEFRFAILGRSLASLLGLWSVYWVDIQLDIYGVSRRVLV